MPCRLPYYLLLVSAALFILVKGTPYIREVRLGLAGTPAGFLQLFMLLAMVVAAVIAVRMLLGRPSPHRPAGQRQAREAPFNETPHRLHTVIRRAIAHRPVLASTLSVILGVVLACIPISLVAMGRVGGVGTFGLREWILVGVAELPIVFVVVIVLIRFMSGRNSSR